jgi:DNA repair photolyase
MAPTSYLEDRCKSALNRVATGSPLPYDWTVNPYRGCTHSCHYCFARAYHAYLDLGIGADFERLIVVKTNIATVLRSELSSPRWLGTPVAMGTATDPYQPCEGRYRLTRDVLEALSDYRTPLSMLTKSTLVVRDLDLFAELDTRAGATLAMSIASVEDSFRRTIEPGTPPSRSRLEVLRRFSSAGIRTGVLVAPIMPYINDSPDDLRRLVEGCAAVGVGYVSGVVLHIRPGIRGHFWPWLRRARPDLYPQYRELYEDRSHAPVAYRETVAERLGAACARAGLEGRPARLSPRAAPRDTQLRLDV